MDDEISELTPAISDLSIRDVPRCISLTFSIPSIVFGRDIIVMSLDADYS